MGRGGKAERLANPASKMASQSMADRENFVNFDRPFHEASQGRKIVCPEEQCLQQHLFFAENGIGQHFRSIHKKEAKERDLARAAVKMQEHYGRETCGVTRIQRHSIVMLLFV